MSGSIGRSYLIQSWNDASSYSGEQIGQRLKESTELFLKNGQANTALFAEPEAPKKTKKPIPIAHQITPQQRSLDKLDQQELSLHKAYKNEEVSLEEYEELLYALDQKRERAFKSLCKALGRRETSDSDHPVGQCGWEEKTSNNRLYGCNKLVLDMGSLSMMGCKKNDWKSDMKLFLTGSIIGLIILLTLVNI